jgi:hypothetical protein
MAKKKKSTKKSTTSEKSEEEIKKKLYDWIAEGYEIEPLMEVVKTKDEDKISETFKKYEENIKRMEKLKQRLAKLEFDRESSRFEELLESFKNPDLVDDVERFLVAVESGPKLQELRAELASLNVTGFEAEAEKLRLRLRNPKDIDQIEKDIKALKRRIKEKFFMEAFEDVVLPTEEKGKEFVAETIFLLHRDGTLLTVKSKIPPSELDKRLLSKMVMTIREHMAKAFDEGEHIHTINFKGHDIILEESEHVYAAVVVNGEAKSIMYKIIHKALQIMEKKMTKQFDKWTGDRAKLENMDKYTTAIFQALDKVG